MNNNTDKTWDNFGVVLKQFIEAKNQEEADQLEAKVRVLSYGLPEGDTWAICQEGSAPVTRPWLVDLAIKGVKANRSFPVVGHGDC